MIKTTCIQKIGKTWLLVLGVLCWVSFSATAQEEREVLSDREVIETTIDLDEILNSRSKGVDAEDSSIVNFPSTNDRMVPRKGTIADFKLQDDEVIRINQTLKKVIEENEQLQVEKKRLFGELKTLRGQHRIELNRINLVTEEVQGIRDRTKSLLDLNKSYSQQLIDLRAVMSQKEKDYELKIKELSERAGRLPGVISGTGERQSVQSARSFGSNQGDILALVKRLNRQNNNLKMDTAQVHYNLGNNHFHRGAYIEATQEYRRALELFPIDASAHFNLAFVSGEFLGDHVTALRHYQEYLFLNPEADDAGLVKDKILQARLYLRTMIDSPIDR